MEAYYTVDENGCHPIPKKICPTCRHNDFCLKNPTAKTPDDCKGFEVLGIDIVNAPKKLGYKHKFLQADIRNLKVSDIPVEFQKPEVTWGSPPCRNFTSIARIARNWKEPCDPAKGLELVNAYLNLKEEINPSIWIMENVPGLKKYVKMKHAECWIKPNMRRLFYGNFPPFLMPRTEKFIAVEKQSPRAIRSWKSAKIPLPCSRAFAIACKQALTFSQKERRNE